MPRKLHFIQYGLTMYRHVLEFARNFGLLAEREYSM